MHTDKVTKGYRFKGSTLQMQQLTCFPSIPSPTVPSPIPSPQHVSCLSVHHVLSTEWKGQNLEGLWCSWCVASSSQSGTEKELKKVMGWWVGEDVFYPFSSERFCYGLCHLNSIVLSSCLTLVQHPSQPGCIIDRRVLTGDRIDVLRLTLLINRTNDYCERAENK